MVHEEQECFSYSTKDGYSFTCDLDGMISTQKELLTEYGPCIGHILRRFEKRIETLEEIYGTIKDLPKDLVSIIDSCEEIQPVKLSLCKYYIKGRCRQRSKCKYLHAKDYSKITAPRHYFWRLQKEIDVFHLTYYSSYSKEVDVRPSYRSRDGQTFRQTYRDTSCTTTHSRDKLLREYPRSKSWRVSGGSFYSVTDQFDRRVQALDILYVQTELPKDIVMMIVDRYSDYKIEETVISVCGGGN